jgi:hypothetical protein
MTDFFSDKKCSSACFFLIKFPAYFYKHKKEQNCFLNARSSDATHDCRSIKAKRKRRNSKVSS